MLAIIMLVLIVIVQASYLILCLVKGGWQDRIKQPLRFTMIGVLILLICLFGHGFSFQWWALGLLLAFQLVVGIIQVVISKKRELKPRPFYRWRAILGFVGSLLLFFIALLPAMIFPPYKLPAITGDYKVGYKTFTYVDDSRREIYGEGNREVNVAIWYPEGASGTYPLVVFSHGFSGIKNSNESAFMDLASNGYVVCSIDHPYHAFYTMNEDQKITLIDQGYQNEYKALRVSNKVEKLSIFQKWMDIRVKDISFVIDTVLNTKGSIYQLVDPTKIGVFGHSLGGAAAMGVPRIREDIGAVINIDAPMMAEFTGVENDAYTINQTPYPAPLLQIYSEYLYENGIVANDEEYFENRLVAATAPASYEVVLSGTQHMSLTDLTLFSPILARMLDNGRIATADSYETLVLMNRIMLQFFDAYLKDKGSFMAAGIY